MKNIIKIIFLLAFIINTCAFIILKDYKFINLVISDSVIVLSFLLQMKFYKSNASDGFKIALTFIAPIFSLISFILAVLLPNNLENNFFLILLIISVSIQILLTTIPQLTGKLIKNK
jgi:hypothetical protein